MNANNLFVIVLDDVVIAWTDTPIELITQSCINPTHERLNLIDALEKREEAYMLITRIDLPNNESFHGDYLEVFRPKPRKRLKTAQRAKGMSISLNNTRES